MNKNDRIYKEALVSNNVLAEEELVALHADAKSGGLSLKEYLIANDLVNERQLLVSLSQYLGLDTVNLSAIEVEKSLIEKIPIKFAWYYKFMPVEVKSGVLTIAVAGPLDVTAQDEIRMHSGFSVKLVLCTDTELQDALKKYYGFASETIDKIITKDPSRIRKEADPENVIEDLERQSEDPTVSNLVNQIILEAYKKRATDIHIEPYRNKVRFRYRIDGVLIDANLPDNVKHFLPAILSRIKILANLSITEKRLPQDGSAVVRTKEQQLDLRVSTIPTPRGESMVIRILPSKVMLFSLEKLGVDEESVEKFRHMIRKPHGIIFITGPTGSGKTTTLYACLNEISSSEQKIITIEDPVEYEMDGITQVQVNPKVNFDFSTGLRSLLRHDPDILMVGEVRDLETAEIAIRTALTGHLVFSTLHTNDAASGITRLIDMGIEPYLVASSVEAFVAQRLVRMICPKCKQEEAHPQSWIYDEILKSLRLEESADIRLYKGAGCDHCNNTGYYGRMAIYEILLLNDEIRAAIIEKPRSDYIKLIAMQQGIITLRQNGWKAVLKGMTTVEEVLNVTVKDEEVEVVPKPVDSEDMARMLSVSGKKQLIKPETPQAWAEKNNYDSRIYERAYEPVDLRYRLAKRDPNNPGLLVSDGIDRTTVTEDISAGGLRFVAKELFSIGSMLDVKITLGEKHKPIHCLAKVCRVEEDSLSNVYTVIAYYLDITSADRAAINKFVMEKLQLQPGATAP